MPKRIAFVEAEIDRRIAAVVAADSPDRISARELRDLAREYLAHTDQDARDFPDYADLPHDNLWMSDNDLDNALFVVLIFRRDGVEFFCGTGNAFAIRSVSEDAAAATDIFAVMAENFPNTQPSLLIERPAAALWLGRGWRP